MGMLFIPITTLSLSTLKENRSGRVQLLQHDAQSVAPLV
jgi:hypothetical protein